jgi:Transglutaminase-like superfamily
MVTAPAGTILEFYAHQGPICDPREMGALFEDLPPDVAALCEIVQGLLIHYEEGDMFGVRLSKERRKEIDTRDVRSMLARILKLEDRPLSVARPPEKRLAGCCRDFATLLCSILRHHGIPARVRFGFAAYFQPDFHCDHVICEYWNATEQRWVLVDPQMDEMHQQVNRLTFDVLDVPHEDFILAGRAWQLCREGRMDPERCGVNAEIRGLWFVQSYLVHDVAALNGVELLCWDCWGLADNGPDVPATDEELMVLDRLAALTLSGNEGFWRLRDCYEQDSRLRVGPEMQCYSPAGARTEYVVALDARMATNVGVVGI